MTELMESFYISYWKASYVYNSNFLLIKAEFMHLAVHINYGTYNPSNAAIVHSYHTCTYVPFKKLNLVHSNLPR